MLCFEAIILALKFFSTPSEIKIVLVFQSSASLQNHQLSLIAGLGEGKK